VLAEILALGDANPPRRRLRGVSAVLTDPEAAAADIDDAEARQQVRGAVDDGHHLR
jgi:hypothetical protein